MEFQQFKNAVISAAKARNLEDYELYYETSEDTQVDTFRKEVNEFSSSLSGGVCFRCIHNGKMGYASSQVLSEDEAVRLVDSAIAGAEILENEEEVFLGQGGQIYEALDRKAAVLPSTEEIVETALKNQDALYAADPAVADGTSTCVISESMTLAIVNSRGLDLSYTNAMTGLIAQAVVDVDGEKADSYDICLGDLNKMNLPEFSGKIVKKALSKLGGEPAPTGSYPVIFSPNAAASLLATYSSVFSSKNAQKGLSQLKGKEGTVIASPAVTLTDDPFYEKGFMPVPFDAEGSPAHRKNVIENGKLLTLLYNLETAHKEGRKTTGNASKAGYTSPVDISPFTMYLQPGECSEEELLRKAGNGVYIEDLAGLHSGANQISGDFSLMAAGFLIENGNLTRPVKSFTVAGNFFRFLLDITDTASNLLVPNPSGTTAFGSPSILVKGLTLAGK